jgi:hypothetical protein
MFGHVASQVFLKTDHEQSVNKLEKLTFNDKVAKG